MRTTVQIEEQLKDRRAQRQTLINRIEAVNGRKEKLEKQLSGVEAQIKKLKGAN